uniref:PKcGMP_CC domain-containing protein n=1 Tax=Heterorhabditis bacteriophora TaxID=37862 RepID=A0A1I7W8Q8_HETBA
MTECVESESYSDEEDVKQDNEWEAELTAIKNTHQSELETLRHHYEHQLKDYLNVYIVDWLVTGSAHCYFSFISIIKFRKARFTIYNKVICSIFIFFYQCKYFSDAELQNHRLQCELQQRDLQIEELKRKIAVLERRLAGDEPIVISGNVCEKYGNFLDIRFHSNPVIPMLEGVPEYLLDDVRRSLAVP